MEVGKLIQSESRRTRGVWLRGFRRVLRNLAAVRESRTSGRKDFNSHDWHNVQLSVSVRIEGTGMAKGVFGSS